MRPPLRPPVAGRRGLAVWEMGLFLFFLAVAGGASIFFFFLSSRDMRAAQSQAAWLQRIDLVLDLVARDLENAVALTGPFAGPDKVCLFRRAAPSGSLPPSLEEEGFEFAEGGLVHVVRTASGTMVPRPLGPFENPLVPGLQAGTFERLGPSLLRITCKVPTPMDPATTRTFRRTIHLRNL